LRPRLENKSSQVRLSETQLELFYLLDPRHISDLGKIGNVCLVATEISNHPVIMTEMKLLTEYLERAVSLERLAADEQESQFKNELLRQAAAYRKLAAKRAEDYGLPPPSPPEIPN
jgi:hypothetical protein